MARVLKGSHSFTCTLHVYPLGMNHTCLCLSSRSWYSFTDPGGMEGSVGLGKAKSLKSLKKGLALKSVADSYKPDMPRDNKTKPS